MNIEIKKNTEEIIIEVAGRLDTTTAPNLDKAIKDDIADAENLVLILKKLEYISSAGLFKVTVPIATYTPDGQVFSITAETMGGDLGKALAVGVCYIVVFLFFSSLILKKRDNK